MPESSGRVDDERWLPELRAARLALATCIAAALAVCSSVAVILVTPRIGMVTGAAAAGTVTVLIALASVWGRRAFRPAVTEWLLIGSLAGSAVAGGLFASQHGGLSGLGIGVLIVSWACSVPLASRSVWVQPLGLLAHAGLFTAVATLAGANAELALVEGAMVGAGLVIVTLGGRNLLVRNVEDRAAWEKLAAAQQQLERRRAQLEASTANLTQTVNERLEEALSHVKTTEQLDRLLAGRVARRSRKLAGEVDRQRALEFQPMFEGAVCGRARILGRMSPAPYEHAYLAADTANAAHKWVVAIVSPAQSAVQAPRLTDELSASRVQHPSVAGIDSALAARSGDIAVLLEHRPGRLLIHALGRADLSVSDAVQLAHAIAEPLAVAHETSIQHLGLDPYRVVIGSAGRGVSLYGVGLAQAWHRAGGEPTEAFRLIATPAYRAPLHAISAVGREAEAIDVYALGVLAFEMLAKLHPFVARVAEDGSNAASTLARVVPELSAGIAELLQRMLARDDAARPTMRAVEIALRDEAKRLAAADVHAICSRLAGSLMMKAVPARDGRA